MSDDDAADSGGASEATENFEVLDNEYRIKVTNFLNEKSVKEDDNCPVCDSPDNIVVGTPYLVRVPPAPDANVPFSDASMPLLATLCSNCGYARFFSRKWVDKLLEEGSSSKEERKEPGDKDAG